MVTDFMAGLTYWSSDVYKLQPEHSWAYYAGLYAFFQICGLMSLLLLAIVIFIVSIDRVGANVHQAALQTLIEAPLSFFTSTDTGIVTNLFSQDLNLVDTELPNALLNLLISVSTPMHSRSSQERGGDHLMLTSLRVGVLSYRTSSCNANIFSLHGHQLSIPGHLIVRRPEVLSEDR